MQEPKSESASQTEPGSLWRQTLAAQTELDRGFDGVLLFVAITRVLSPLLLGYDLYLNLRLFLQPNVYRSLYHLEYPDFNRGVAVVSLGESIGTSFFLLFNLVLLWLFFRRRRAFRPAMIAYLLLNIGIPVIVLWISLLFGAFNRDALFYAGFGALWALFWVPYFVCSDRVKNTFVH